MSVFATTTAGQHSECGVIRCMGRTASGDRCRRRFGVFLDTEPRTCWQHRAAARPADPDRGEGQA